MKLPQVTLLTQRKSNSYRRPNFNNRAVELAKNHRVFINMFEWAYPELREKYVFSYGFGTGFSGFCTGKLRVRNYGVLEIRVFSNGNTGFPNGNTGLPAGSTGLSNGNTGFPARKRFPTGNAGLLAKSHQVLCCLAPTSSQIFRRRLGAASNLVWEERTKLGGNC